MINLLNPGLGDRLISLCGNDPSGLRIAAAFQSYGTDFPFCEFWLQSGERGEAAVIARVDGCMTVCGVSPDTYELSEFLQAVGGSEVFTSYALRLEPPFTVREKGVVMRCNSNAPMPRAFSVDASPKLDDVYAVLSASGQAEALGEHDAWYVDVSHRVRHKTARAAVFYCENLPAACAMAVAETPSDALLGGVAVQPCFRGRGFGAGIVSALCGALNLENKNVCLCCAEGLTGFYKKLGFEPDGGWAVWSITK